MQEIIKKYRIKAKKSLWQNFLVSGIILKEISEILEIKEKNIIEVWPWFWALTEKILEKNPKSLTLVELDKDMIEILKNRIKNNEINISKTNKFEIKNIDILKFFPEKKIEYFVIANIPYYITSPILRHFLYEIENIPKKMLILMQKDVGDKILNIFKEKPKSSVLSLFIAKKAYVSEKLFVSKNNFIPAPKVESSVLLFETHKNYENIDDESFLKFIKIWFSSNRKKLIKNLVLWWFKKEILQKIFSDLNISENSRAENLNIEKWCKLSQKLEEMF